MNRREMIAGTAAAGAVASLAAMPVAALPWTEILRHRRVEYVDGAMSNPHAQIAARWCLTQMDAGILYTRTEFMERWIKLTDPKFKIVPGAPVWSWMTGDTKETGVGIFVEERGIPLGSTRIATNIGYEEYFDRPRDEYSRPDYFVRPFRMSDDVIHQIGEVLGRDHVGYDMRWLDRYQKEV